MVSSAEAISSLGKEIASSLPKLDLGNKAASSQRQVKVEQIGLF